MHSALDGRSAEGARAWLLAGSRLDLTVTVTGQCNFRCTYCYEDFSHGAIEPWVLQALIRLLDERSADLEELVLRFFGGEPLLEIRSIYALASAAARLANSSGFQYSGAVTTNASLLSVDVAKQLSDVGVRAYQISLDGPAPQHDVSRVLRSGRGTFDRIWGNLRALSVSDLPLEIDIRCHVSHESADAWIEFAPQLKELAEDGRFQLAIEPIGRLGGPGDNALRIAEEEELRRVRDAFDVATAEDSEFRGACYAAVPTAWVITPGGLLSRCTVIGDERNAVGQLTPEGKMIVDTDRLQPWLQGWEENADPALLVCPLKGLRPAQKPSVFIGIDSLTTRLNAQAR